MQYMLYMTHIKDCNQPPVALQPSPTLAFERALAAAGWTVDFLDLDLTRSAPAVTLRCSRGDGLWIWANVDPHGRCTLERFYRDRQLGMSLDTKGRRPLSPQINDTFLGRSHAQGPRALLRITLGFIADNAIQPTSVSVLRSALSTHLDRRLIVDPDRELA